MTRLSKSAFAALIVTAVIALPLVASAQVVSLRGDSELSADSDKFDRKKPLTASGGFERAWKLQPPTIPHNTDNDRITLKENTCLNCHSKETFKKEKAPLIGDSHFVDASGKMLPDVNMRRHFCTQCHVPQMDAKPLIDNVFVGAK